MCTGLSFCSMCTAVAVMFSCTVRCCICFCVNFLHGPETKTWVSIFPFSAVFENVLVPRFKRILACAGSVWEVSRETLRLPSFSRSDFQNSKNLRTAAKCREIEVPSMHGPPQNARACPPIPRASRHNMHACAQASWAHTACAAECHARTSQKAVQDLTSNFSS